MSERIFGEPGSSGNAQLDGGVKGYMAPTVLMVSELTYLFQGTGTSELFDNLTTCERGGNLIDSGDDCT